MAARGESFVIEFARILKIADAAHSSLQFRELPIAQVRRDLVVAKRNGNSDTSVGSEFQNKLVPAFGKCGRRDYAAIQDHCFVSARIERGRAAGLVDDGKKCAEEQEYQ